MSYEGQVPTRVKGVMAHVIGSFIFFFSSRRRHTRFKCDWSSDVCSSDLDCHVVAGDLKAARKDLEQARQVNPRDENTLGKLAACLLLERDQRGFDALAAEVLARDPKPGAFYFALAERLEDYKDHEQAAQTY